MTLGAKARTTVAGSVAALLAAVLANSEATAATLALDRSHDQFCAEVQRRLVDTPLPIENVIEPDFEAFKQSKPGIEPLRTHQFVERDAAGAIRGISCKTKTADHLLAVHGDTAVTHRSATRSCSDIQRAIVLETWTALTPSQRRTAQVDPSKIFLQADSLSYTGSSWVKTPATLTTGSDGWPRLRASALLAHWEDWRWKMMPASWRGNHYCHLVAPEQVRTLLLAN